MTQLTRYDLHWCTRMIPPELAAADARVRSEHHHRRRVSCAPASPVSGSRMSICSVPRKKSRKSTRH